jgi:murein DD-endopeptidase MepM/ murein hydrolase activator NlpD
MALTLTKTEFTRYFIKENGLSESVFKEWVLYSGMLFRATDKWWGDRGRRSRPHEGIDLCFYKDPQERIHALAEGVKIPAMYDGTVAGIINDFIGKSIIIKHRVPGNDSSWFCTIYGHTTPEADICTGRTVREGEVIAAVAGLSGPVAGMGPHLHISIGSPASGVVSWDTLAWKHIGDPGVMKLIDPLQVIDRYSS